jgi:hypothetical protein
MPKTKISGVQIQDESVQTNVFAPESIDGNIIINGTITNDKVDTVDAAKILIADVSNSFTASNVETALEEAATNLKNLNTTINTQMTNQISTLNSTVAANKTDIENKLTIRSNELQNNIDVTNSTIVSNKSDIEGKLSTEASALNNTIIANRTDIENKLANEVTTLNTTISNNKADIEGKLANEVKTLEDNISVLNGNVTGNVSQQIADLDVTKAELAGSLTQNFNANTFTVAGDILPSTTQNINIGSSTNRFKAIYADEAYLSTNTLYLGDTAVMGTSADTINIKADVDQSINIKTTGVGQTILTSAEGVQVSTNDMNADVDIKAIGVGSNVKMSAAREVAMTAPNVSVAGDMAVTGNTQVQGLTVSGNLTVKGQVIDVQATTVQVTDNIIELNKGEVGNGVTAGQAGLRVDRGQAVDYIMAFDETDDMFKVGMQGQLETIASQPWVQANMYVHPTSHPASMITEDSTHRFVTDAERTKLTGIETGANLYVHPDTHLATMITEDTTHRWFTDTERIKLTGIETGANLYVHPDAHPASMITEDAEHMFVSSGSISRWNGYETKIIPVTTTNDGLMSATDKAKLNGIQAGAEVNQKAFSLINVNGIDFPAATVSDVFKILAGNNMTIDTDATNKTIKINNNYEYIPPTTLPASMIVEDSTHRFVSDLDKSNWTDKYTKGEVDNKFSALSTGLDWKESVATFADIATTYPTPVDGWVVNVKDTDITYRFNGTQWIAISANSIPMVTTTIDGKMSAADKVKLDSITANADKVEASANNGNIKINGSETVVYTHPATHAPSIIAQDANNRFMTDTEKTKLSNCKQAMSGSSVFAGLSVAKTISLPTTMANTNYAVNVQATEATNGNLGEVWVVKTTTSITVYNTGSFTGAFDWMVLY